MIDFLYTMILQDCNCYIYYITPPPSDAAIKIYLEQGELCYQTERSSQRRIQHKSFLSSNLRQESNSLCVFVLVHWQYCCLLPCPGSLVTLCVRALLALLNSKVCSQDECLYCS